MRRILRAPFLFSVAVVVANAASAQTAFPTVVKSVPPAFLPAGAYPVRAEGRVDVAVMVDASGTVQTASAVSAHQFLRKAAEMTVKQWKFSAMPGTHYLTITIEYHIGHRESAVITYRGEYYLVFTSERSRIS